MRWVFLQGAALLILAVGTTWLLQRGESMEESKRLTSKSHSLAQLLAQAAGPDYSAGDSARLLRVLECATRGGDLRAAAIVDDTGLIVAHTDVSLAGSSLGTPLPIGPIGERESALLSMELFGESGGRVILHPLLGAEGVEGTAALLLPDPDSTGLSADWVRMLLPAGLLLLAFTLVTQGTIRWAMRPASDFMNRLAGALECEEKNAAAEDENETGDESGIMDMTVTRVTALTRVKDELIIKSRLLNYEKKRMEMILDAFPDGLIVTDLLKNVVLVNRRALNYLGINDDGAGVRELEGHPEFRRLVREAEKTGRTVLPVEKGARERNILFSRIPLAAGERTAGTLYTMRDVTAQEASQRAQAEFLSQVTHELKAPLNTVITFVEELAEGEDLTPEERKDFCNTLNAETTRMAQLISNLLQLSRIQMGNLSVRFSFIKPAALLKEQSESLRRQAEGKAQRFTVRVPEYLPALAGDKDLLGVAINNLISNAIKYTPEGGEITVSAQEGDGAIEVEVQDTGFGIPEGALDKIWERFYRSEQEEVRKLNGSGLGLSLVKEIVEAHEGEITVESEVGAGTRFRFRLPIKEAGARLDVVETMT
ncbi:MAG: PAS domain-containing protein [Candidatus Eisenbacteria bacterium]|nr:PAS domain-containing protein [Candidatus Eisenbacteria bacterium]